jgi:inner membrane protein
MIPAFPYFFYLHLLSMDSITHIVLGAVIGEALAGKKLGKKAMLLGAIAQSLPDIDFMASFWMDAARDVWVHRGITHSLLFVALLTPLLAWAATRLYRRPERLEPDLPLEPGPGFQSPATPGMAFGGAIRARGMTFGNWCVFFGLQLFIHIFLDAFNAYGTGWFEPFDHYRVSFHILFVADPFYSCWLGISFLALLILKRNSRRRKFWVRFGLIASSLYLYYCIMNKYRVDTLVKKELQQQRISYKRYFTTPTPLNSWLWYIVTEDSAGYHTGYISVFDRKQSKDWRFFPRNDSLLSPFRSHPDVQYLLRFSQGYYTVEQWKDRLVFNVLRFGEMKGWEDPQAHFVFHYFLQFPGDNEVIVQRGRFAGWDLPTVRAFIRRVKGN